MAQFLNSIGSVCSASWSTCGEPGEVAAMGVAAPESLDDGGEL
jgi:hypothetical protein